VLTPEQELALLIGGPDLFLSRAEYERAWWAHREQLMPSVNPLTRPAAWWALEFTGERKPGERDWEALERCGLLTPEEINLLGKSGYREQRDGPRVRRKPG
jgi:hypothetical protein